MIVESVVTSSENNLSFFAVLRPAVKPHCHAEGSWHSGSKLTNICTRYAWS